MQSIIQMFQNLAKDDKARHTACVDNIHTRVCGDIECKNCAYNNHESMQRAANILKNRMGV